MPSWLRTGLRQPLVHFLILGGVIFALHGWQAPEEAAPRRIVISAEEVSGLLAQARRVGGNPDRRALEALVAARVEEEILYREALALGLDQDDVIIRRRLVQKMRFLAEGLAQPEPPSDEELAAFFAERQAEYASPPRLSFEHVYCSRDQRGASAEADARRLLAELRAGGTAVPAGDRLMLEASYQARTAEEIAGLFGGPFAAALLAAEGEAGWFGPVESGYGLHLVRITERAATRLPDLDEVREDVTADYLAWRLEQEDARQRAEMLAAWDVRVEWPPALLAEKADGDGGVVGGSP